MTGSTENLTYEKLKDIILDLTKDDKKAPLNGLVAADYYDGEYVYFYKKPTFVQIMKRRDDY